ncbi:MAG: alpha/beta hydrolase [Siculibacillus sp.]|nr:alpha/beta hydrolase [Siculibacillus sp.]
MASSSIEPFRIDLGDRVVDGLSAGPTSSSNLPLVLLHGIGSAARSFEAVLPLVAADRRVIAWNAPGYGGSTPPDRDAPDAGDHADILLRLLDALGFGRVHLLGHSLGAIVAARFAADHPDRIDTLALASVAHGHARLDPEKRRAALDARLDDLADLGPRGLAEKRGPRLLGPGASAAAIRSVVETMAAIDPVGYARAARLLAGADVLADVARLPAAMPLLVLWGDTDVITPPAANRAVVDLRPGCREVVVASGGHAIYVEKPAEFATAVNAFLGERP